MYKLKKIAFLKRQETKREKGLLRDSEGKKVIARPKLTRNELLKRMKEQWGDAHNLKKNGWV